MIYYKKRSLWKRFITKVSGVNITSSNVLLKILKISLFVVLGLLIAIYFSCFFLLSKYITDENAEKYFNNYLKKHCDLTFNIENLKINSNYKFDIKLKADKISFLYPNNSNFVNIDKADMEINLLTLPFGYLDLNKIKTEQITVNTSFTKSNRYKCFDYFNFEIFKFEDLKLKPRNIKVICNNFIFNLHDENIAKDFKIQSQKLVLISGNNDKPVSIKTQGVLSDGNKISDFKINIELKDQYNFLNKCKSKIANLNYNPLVYASKYKFYANSEVNLKIRNNSISGIVNLSDLSFSIDNIQIPKNNLSLIFKGNGVKAQGNFNLVKNQFIKLNLNANYSKNKFIELFVSSNEIDLVDFKKIAQSLCKIFNVKYNFNSIDIKGKTTVDIFLKSNFKIITSKGYANIKNAEFKDYKTGLILNRINSNINFNNNEIKINNTSAFVGDSKFNLEGSIDKNTNLNLKVNSEPVNIAQIITSIKHIPMFLKLLPELDKYVFKSGFIKINSNIKGNINNPIIKTNSTISNFRVFIKDLKSDISSKEIIIVANPENKIIKEITIIANNNFINYKNNKIINSNANLKITQNDIILEKTQLSFDKIKANIEGVIKNYKQDPLSNLKISANLPFDNNLIVIKNQSPQIVADISAYRNKLTVKNAKIYEGNRNFIILSGNIQDYLSENPYFENMKVSLVNKISCILPKLDNLNFEATADIILSGKLNKPAITGNAKLYNVICKKYNLFIQDCDLIIKNSSIEGNIISLDLLDTTLYNVIFKGILDGNILKITNFNADVFQGKISGNANINIKNLAVTTELILKEISVRHLSGYLKQYSMAVSGKLSALMRLNFIGLDYASAINSLDGYIKFNIDNGELAQFAKLERFLQAGNILSQSVLKLTLNSIISSITKQNTGDFKTIEGTIKINSPMAQIQYINTQGTNMAMHIEGKYNIINNHAILRILGRIPINIVNVMGSIGNFSLSQLFNKQVSQSIIEKMLSDHIDSEDIEKIPSLINYQQNSQTREFIVIIDGLLTSTNAVKYFKWGYKNQQ